MVLSWKLSFLIPSIYTIVVRCVVVRCVVVVVVVVLEVYSTGLITACTSSTVDS